MIRSYISILLLVSLCVFSCSKESEIECIEAELQADWLTENFKNNYDIQFPDDYQGIGMVGFEGNLFSKNSADSSVLLYYFYCGPLWCDDYGAAINISEPSINVILSDGVSEALLDQSQDFCMNGKLIGKLYYNDSSDTFGAYFMEVAGEWREGLRIEYDESKQEEVISILRSIHEDQ